MRRSGMKYERTEYEALYAEVEKQGGALTPDRCTPQDIIYTVPPYAKANRVNEATTGCGFCSIFVSEYDGEKKKPGFVRACAVCDSMGAWPRFEKAVQAANE
jgi:hypothetical protein